MSLERACLIFLFCALVVVGDLPKGDAPLWSGLLYLAGMAGGFAICAFFLLDWLVKKVSRKL